MLVFGKIDKEDFLNNYWQKKPLVIRQALPDFAADFNKDDLAGLAMEEEVESRLVFSTPNKPPFWHLQNGPFEEKDYEDLPPKDWTLLVQGVDKFIPELGLLFDNFNFIPQWRVDDLMISYAVAGGSVGPHYDNYDVFLYQATGSRKWLLTSKECNTDNFIPDVPLRIMDNFVVEDEFILNEGDMLYLPPKVGHHGISEDDDCMTYSFGYRSYVNQELWDDFGDYNSEHGVKDYYQDPIWNVSLQTSSIPRDAWQNAKNIMQSLLDDDEKLKSWFGCFATNLDQSAAVLIPEQRTNKEDFFIKKLKKGNGLIRNTCCRIAYIENDGSSDFQLFINGSEFCIREVSEELIKLIADNRLIMANELNRWLIKEADVKFLFDLWSMNFLDIFDK
ncbi:MAG: cupin domain-containing protein [Legionellaceae bacterium]|nr:cupin domain-containing protein [Legionellaceae bacterium]